MHTLQTEGETLVFFHHDAEHSTDRLAFPRFSEFTIRAEVLSSPQILRHATTNAGKLIFALFCFELSLIPVVPISQKPNCFARSARSEPSLQVLFSDLIVLKENPLVDIRVLDRPEKYLLGVMKGGRVGRGPSEWLKGDFHFLATSWPFNFQLDVHLQNLLRRQGQRARVRDAALTSRGREQLKRRGSNKRSLALLQDSRCE